ncbi:hypothetical protein TNCV_4925301 [Trichonephila clavipes]|nr:hypothetical protein TNCV_4925301 [Trichonephila clavipes]
MLDQPLHARPSASLSIQKTHSPKTPRCRGKIGAASDRRFSYKGKWFYVYPPSEPAGMAPINRWPLSKLAEGPTRPSTLRL